MVAKNCVYTENHEWVRTEGDSIIVGITDYAQQELGEIVFVELPQEGAAFAAGDAAATIESVKTVSDTYAPVSGTVESVNTALENTPELINSDPYGEGWVITMKPDNMGDLDTLLKPEAYEKLLEEV